MEAEVQNREEKSQTVKFNKNTCKEDQESVLLAKTEKIKQPSSAGNKVESAVKQNHGPPTQEEGLAKKSPSLEVDHQPPTKKEQTATEFDKNKKANLSHTTREKNINSSKERPAQEHKLQSKSVCVVKTINGKGTENVCPKMCKPRSDPNIKSTQDQKSKSDSMKTSGHKMCKPCSETDMKSIQELKNKMDSARASGKSINALLYSMDNDDNNNEEEKIQASDEVKNGYNQQGVSFSLEADELSGKLGKLTVDHTEEKTTASAPTDSNEDSNFLRKGPMTAYQKHTNLYHPFNRQDRIHQPPPQQVPGNLEIGEEDVSVDKFYDEDSLLKALEGIAPESSPEHYPTQPLPNENFTEILPLPPACPSGVNNQFLYLQPTHQMSSPRTQNTGSMSSLPENFMLTPCTNPQQRSTSADAIKKTEFVSVPCEPRPNSYPSTHNEIIEDLFKDASDIIDKDLRKANQHNPDQRLKMANPENVPALQQQTRRNPPNPSYTASSFQVPRTHPSSNHCLGEFNTQGNQNFTRVMAARPSKISDQPSQFHPKPREVQAPLTKSSFQEGSNGNLPNILCEITDNPLETKNPVSKPSPFSQNMNTNNNLMALSTSNGFPVSHIINAPTGGPQIQQNMPFPQNQTLIHRPNQVSDSSLRPKTGHSKMIELGRSNNSPPFQVIKTTMHPSSDVAQGRMKSASHNMTNTTTFLHGFPQQLTNGQMMPNSTGHQPMCNPNVQQGPQPLQQGPVKVFICQPTTNNNPKPRYRKILPKPTPPVEGGK